MILGFRHNWVASALTLLLSVLHLVSGFMILLVASWFIAASSIAGLHFNYMLPAVVIRALALIRIGSGYFAMLFGHRQLLSRLAAIRMEIFTALADTAQTERATALDALHHQSEEVAAIWISWIGQNAGTVGCLLMVNIACWWLTPSMTIVTFVFTSLYLSLYLGLLLSCIDLSSKLVSIRKQHQYICLKHIESAPLWHLQAKLESAQPSGIQIRNLEAKLQMKLRTCQTLLFGLAITCLLVVFHLYSATHAGNPLFMMLPMALLATNDWLTPSLSGQRKLSDYLNAKRGIEQALSHAPRLKRISGELSGLTLHRFRADHTHMNCVSGIFDVGGVHLIEGGSGAGKSRLLQAITGLIAHTGERYCAQGRHVVCSRGLLNDALYIEQFPYCLSDTLRENLKIAQSDFDDVKLRAVLSSLGLAHLDNLDQWLGEHGRLLSGGEQKRIGVARAALSDASIVLIDEPFEGLDRQSISNVCEVLNSMAKQRIVIVASHVLPDVLHVRQRISLDQPMVSNSEQVALYD